jgi:urease accessory protein
MVTADFDGGRGGVPLQSAHFAGPLAREAAAPLQAWAMEHSLASLVLVHRLATGEPGGAQGCEVEPLRLLLTADQRTSLRGHRRSACGQDLVLQLPRGAALQPGEALSTASGDRLVRVEAAPEALLLVRSPDPLALLQAAYHLGNRHVAMELHPGELRILEDSVLADLLRQRGLAVERLKAPFEPEAGAYGSGHSHSPSTSPSHSPSHSHDHGHDNSHDHSHSHDRSHDDGHGDGHSHGPKPDPQQGPGQP